MKENKCSFSIIHLLISTVKCVDGYCYNFIAFISIIRMSDTVSSDNVQKICIFIFIFCYKITFLQKIWLKIVYKVFGTMKIMLYEKITNMLLIITSLLYHLSLLLCRYNSFTLKRRYKNSENIVSACIYKTIIFIWL